MLMNALSTLARKTTLVLDDYHLIDAPEIHRTMTVMLDHLPAHVHLFIASRADPPLPLARLRMCNDLLELRPGDLYFTGEEATDFFRQTMGLVLSDQTVAALESRTEGWIAGLQLAALSLKGHEDVSSFLAAFTTSPFPHRHVADYLVQEVLEQQPEPVRMFLLRTCILDRLTSALCQALSEIAGAQEMLRLLERRNVFLVPLDEQRIWYRYHQLEAYLRHAQCSLAGGEKRLKRLDYARLQSMQGEIMANLSAIVRIKGEIAAARVYAFEALALLPSENIVYRDLAARTLVNIYLNHSDVEAANRALEEFALLGRTTQDTLVALNALNSMATIQTLQGKLHEALATYREIIRRAEQQLKQWPPAWSCMSLGGILLEWNALDEAELYLARALDYGKKTDNLDVLVNSYQQLALLHCARGDFERASACIDAIEQMMPKAPHFVHRRLDDVCQALRAWLALAQGDLTAARRWAQSYRHANDIDEAQVTQLRIAELIVLARVYLADNRLAAAAELLEHLLPLARKAQRMHNVLSVLILQALVFSTQGNTKRAIATLLQALEMAEPGGYVRTFVNEGAPMAALLLKVLEVFQADKSPLMQRVSIEYIRALLAALEQRVPALHSQGKPPNLSKREREVVYLMSLGLSDREIAQRLVLTENTIKTHVKRIYARLNVKNRAQAVTRARELRLF